MGDAKKQEEDHPSGEILRTLTCWFNLGEGVPFNEETTFDEAPRIHYEENT